MVVVCKDWREDSWSPQLLTTGIHQIQTKMLFITELQPLVFFFFLIFKAVNLTLLYSHTWIFPDSPCMEHWNSFPWFIIFNHSNWEFLYDNAFSNADPFRWQLHSHKYAVGSSTFVFRRLTTHSEERLHMLGSPWTIESFVASLQFMTLLESIAWIYCAVSFKIFVICTSIQDANHPSWVNPRMKWFSRPSMALEKWLKAITG